MVGTVTMTTTRTIVTLPEDDPGGLYARSPGH
jgi:hypothetical protein